MVWFSPLPNFEELTHLAGVGFLALATFLQPLSVAFDGRFPHYQGVLSPSCTPGVDN